jgi:hypothetical protein
MKKLLVLMGAIAGAHFTLCCACMVFFRNGGFGLLPEQTLSRFSHLAYALLPICPAPIRRFGCVECIALFLLNGALWSGGIGLLVYTARFICPRRAAQPGAPPNGGPTIGSGSSGVAEGPPSVS